MENKLEAFIKANGLEFITRKVTVENEYAYAYCSTEKPLIIKWFKQYDNIAFQLGKQDPVSELTKD